MNDSDLWSELSPGDRVIVVASGALLVWAVTVVVATFFPSEPATFSLVRGAWALMFPLYAVAIVRRSGGLRRPQRSRRPPRSDVRRILRAAAQRLPRRLRLTAFAIVAASFAIVVLSMLQALGQGGGGEPVIINGKHALNTHGSITYVTSAEYHHQQALWVRIFMGMVPLFAYGAFLLTIARPRGTESPAVTEP